MTTPHDGAVIPADPVLEGELLDDDRLGARPQQSRPAALWWQRNPHIPRT
jgi:hypothetical protein